MVKLNRYIVSMIRHKPDLFARISPLWFGYLLTGYDQIIAGILVSSKLCCVKRDCVSLVPKVLQSSQEPEAQSAVRALFHDILQNFA